MCFIGSVWPLLKEDITPADLIQSWSQKIQNIAYDCSWIQMSNKGLYSILHCIGERCMSCTEVDFEVWGQESLCLTDMFSGYFMVQKRKEESENKNNIDWQYALRSQSLTIKNKWKYLGFQISPYDCLLWWTISQVELTKWWHLVNLTPRNNCKCSVMLVNLAGVTTLNLSHFAFQTMKIK